MATTYTFNGSEGAPIPLATAKTWAANYRATLPDPEKGLKAHFFGFKIIEKILAEGGCMGIRIYYGIDDKGQKQLMLVGADATGENLYPSEGTAMKDVEGDNTIADASLPCPEYCPEIPL